MANEHGRERITVLITEKTCKALELGAIRRQSLRLLVVDHLQPVLDRAQEAIRRCQIVARGGIDPAFLFELAQRGERLPSAQGGIASAGDQLLRLREELDFANAAAAELDVVTLNRDLAVSAIGVDLPFHRMHVRERDEIEIFAPDEG